MKKRKIMSLCLAMLAMSMFLGVVGCDEKHSHSYELNYFISEGKAYSYQECDCGKKLKEKEIENAIIATPETAQAVLNGDINGKVVVFDEGLYSYLNLKPTNETVSKIMLANATKTNNANKAIPVNEINKEEFKYLAYQYDKAVAYEDKIAAKDVELDEKFGQYIAEDWKHNLMYNSDLMPYVHFYRNINNVIFAGTEGAIFTDKISVENNAIKTEEIYGGDWSCGYDHITFENVSFYGMYFTNSHTSVANTLGGIWINTVPDVSDAFVKNIEIKNCNFHLDSSNWLEDESVATIVRAAVFIAPSEQYFDNNGLILNNNKIIGEVYTDLKDNISKTGYKDAFAIYHMKNIEIKNNYIDSISNKSFNLQSNVYNETTNPYAYIGGNVLIENNTIKNVDAKDRGIRGNIFKDATIVIKNNNFDTLLYDDQIINIVNAINSSLEFTHNQYNGNQVSDIKKEKQNIGNLVIKGV